MQQILPQVILIALDMKPDRKGMWWPIALRTQSSHLYGGTSPNLAPENRIGHIAAIEDCRLDSSLTAP